jgi:sugar phosphate isomerase/epimerase
MIIGVRAHDYGKHSPADLLGAIAKDGWKAVQLAFPKAIKGVESFDDITPEIVSDVKSAATENGIFVAVVGVYVEPSYLDEAKRKEQIRHLHNALPIVKELGAGCVGTETTGRSADSGISALYKSLEELLPEAERLGVNIGIEPVHRHTLCTPELARQMLRDFSSSSLKIIFDPLNLLSPDLIDTQNDLWKRCLDCFGEYIVAIHMKGASRESDSNGMLTYVPFAQSILDHENLFPLIKDLNVPILREDAKPAEAASDIAFISKYLRG